MLLLHSPLLEGACLQARIENNLGFYDHAGDNAVLPQTPQCQSRLKVFNEFIYYFTRC